MRRVLAILLALAAAALVPAGAGAASSSLPHPPGPDPGPKILYSKPARAPQLQNRGVWHARPILTSGATAYRGGEFLYQDFLYDDHGAREAFDPKDPRASGDTFSKPNGTYTYPSDERYADNAADLVELRVKPLRRATAFRVTLNTLKDPSTIALSIAIGGRKGKVHPFPHGANVTAPAQRFLTVHPRGSRLVGELTRADGTAMRSSPRVRVFKRQRQIQIRVAHGAWNPRKRTVRLAAGVGLWDAAAHRYLLPQVSADATRPGGSGGAANPPAFFNVAFRADEPFPSPTDGLAAVNDAAWWRDREQGTELARGDISPFFARVSFRKLARRARDNSGVPRKGPLDRILASHYEPAQGANFSEQCGIGGAGDAGSCTPEFRGRLQPYAIYVPRKAPPPGGYGMTLLLHSLSANYNQYLGTRNQSQFGERPNGSIVITPEARGPDLFYEGIGAADVFEVWADVARRYRLDPSYVDITGYSMGGIGTFKLGAQFPDLFARVQPTVGSESNGEVLASLRNVPILMWNNHGDELVNEVSFQRTASDLDDLGYRYELDAYQPCANPMCSPLFPNHLQLAVNDQYAPAAAFLGSARVDRNPFHVTYVVDPARNRPEFDLVGDHAYWVSKVKPQATSTEAKIDAISRGFGRSDPPVSARKLGTGALPGGNLGTLTYTKQARTWGKAPSAKRANRIKVDATNVASASLDVRRAHVGCDVQLDITSDGPVAIKLPGCDRTVHGG